MELKRKINHWTNFKRTYCRIQILTVFVFIVSIINGQQVQCSLQKNSDSLYVGFCHIKDSLVFSLNLKPPKGERTGVWKGKSSAKDTVPSDLIFLEITPEGGTLATAYRSGTGMPCGWYDISYLETISSKIRFEFNLQELCKPQKRNITILEKARLYLSDSTKWDRNDNRISGRGACQSNTEKKTLFCALYEAQTNELGGFYGGPSFWALIRAIQQLGQYQHPIQAFNNDLKINFQTLQKVFDDAIARVSQSFKIKQ